jgi:DivIVA domain-containing protein
MARLTRLSGEDLHGQLFDRSFRGYDCGQVDHLMAQCRDELYRRDREWEALIHERDALQQETGSLRTKLGMLDANEQAQIVQDQAVTIVSAAQRQAEQHVAEAQGQCRQMSDDARNQYYGIIAQAQQRAEIILADAHRTATAAGNMAATAYRAASAGEGYQAQKEQLEREVAYLQTFSAAWRSQLRTLFQNLGEQVEQWPPDEAPSHDQPIFTRRLLDPERQSALPPL